MEKTMRKENFKHSNFGGKSSELLVHCRFPNKFDFSSRRFYIYRCKQIFDFLKIVECITLHSYSHRHTSTTHLLGYGNFSRRQFRQMAAKNMKFVGAFSLSLLLSTPSKLRIKHLFGWSLHNIGENQKGMCSFFDIDPTFL